MKNVLAVFTSIGLVACSGLFGDEDSTTGKPGAKDLDSAPATSVASLPLRRLSKKEYANTLRDLVAIALPNDADAMNTALAPVIARLPDDALVTANGERRGGFHRLDQDLQQTHADIQYAIAAEVGRQFTSSADRISAVFGCSATPDDACVGTFLKKYGEHVLRRAVTDDDVAFYKRPLEGSAINAEALADVVALLFSAPDLFYVVERQGDANAKDRPLAPYELASRLSYHFWETLPDEELFAHARDGSLAKDDVYTAQVDRLAKSPRARVAVDELFGEWLRLDELDRLDTRNGDPVFDAFVGTDVPTEALRANMFADVLEAAAWVTAHGGKLKDLLENKQSFAKTADVAAIYGVPVWDGTSEPIAFPDPTRAGLLTRAAFLATGSANTRPIMKGVRIRMGLLCDSIPPPPPNAAATHIDLSATLTTRQVVESLTQGQGSSCSGCHASQINPLGFATENFDALGRSRTAQKLFDRFGNEIAERDVTTSSVPRITNGDTRVSAGAADLTKYIIESQKVEKCFARNYFRFAFGRNETKDDEPLIGLIAISANDKSIAEIFSAIALRPEFKSKTVKEDGQ